MVNIVNCTKFNALRKTQNMIYKLVFDFCETNEPIEFDNIRNLWMETVGTKYIKIDGKLTTGQLNYKNEPIIFRSEEIDYIVKQWFFRNVGSLVARGYLKVTPVLKI